MKGGDHKPWLKLNVRKGNRLKVLSDDLISAFFRVDAYTMPGRFVFA